MAEYEMRYGREKQSFSLPDGLDVITLRGREMPVLPDPVKALRDALADPVGRPPLARQVRDKANAMIVVADHTRYYGYELWLPALLNELNAAGLPDGKICLYVGNGTHRPPTAEEKRARYGAEVCRRVAILDHDCDSPQMEKVGRTDYGTTVYVDERVYKSELLIVTGGITYHYFAGYSGGRKAILPGVCGRESIRANHARAYDARRRDFAERVLPGSLLGNPVNEDMHEATTFVRPDMCVNVVLDAQKQIAWLGAGDYGYVLRIGAQFLDKYNRLTVARPADVALIGAGGYPKDLNLFQAHKSLRHSIAALNDGATVIWCAECSEGEGPGVMSTLRAFDLDQMHEHLQRDFNLGSACSFSLKTLARRFDIHMVTALDPDIVRGWGLTPHGSLSAALASALPSGAEKQAWLFAPDMSNLLPELPQPAAPTEEDASAAGAPGKENNP